MIIYNNDYVLKLINCLIFSPICSSPNKKPSVGRWGVGAGAGAGIGAGIGVGAIVNGSN